MNKIAICFSGHIRDYNIFDKCINAINNNVIDCNKSYEFDFFMHTWNNLNWRCENVDTLVDVDILKSKLDFKDIMKSSQLDFNFPNLNQYIKECHVHGGTYGETVYNMFYTIKKVNELKVKYENINNFKYDGVIRIRPDFEIKGKLCIDNLNLEKFNIINSGIVWDTSKNDFSCFPDWFCVSNSKNIDYYADIFDKFEYLVEITKTFRPEGLVYRNIKNSDIGYDLINLCYCLIRVGGNNLTFWKGARQENFNW